VNTDRYLNGSSRDLLILYTTGIDAPDTKAKYKLQITGLAVIMPDATRHKSDATCDEKWILVDHPAQWIAPKRAAMEKQGRRSFKSSSSLEVGIEKKVGTPVVISLAASSESTSLVHVEVPLSVRNSFTRLNICLNW